ncbi:hypothetical protein ACETU7_36235 [Rhodococcus sp. 3Y1]
MSVGAILAVPGIRGALRTTAAKVVGLSPSSAENRCAAWLTSASR